jgi:hypothetical protein
MIRRLLATGACATVALGAALALAPHERRLALVAYVDFACALLLFGLARAVCRTLPPQARRARVAPGSAEPPIEQSDWLDRQLHFARASAEELHRSFRPVVVQVAAAQLARKHGVALEREPDRARSLVSERLWELIRPDRPTPQKRGRGLRPEELERVIAELEELQ